MKEQPQKENVDLIFLIDRSGSMGGFEEDTMGGFNSFIEREKSKNESTTVTTILFDDKYEKLYEREPIEDVKPLTGNEYWVRGCTALLDAIGRTINSLDKKINNKVLFVIMTDGYENASKEYSKSQITNLINNHSWEFIYIGADIDSYSEASQIGLHKSRVANYTRSRESVDRVYTSIDSAINCLREDVSLDNAEWKKDLNEYD